MCLNSKKKGGSECKPPACVSPVGLNWIGVVRIGGIGGIGIRKRGAGFNAYPGLASRFAGAALRNSNPSAWDQNQKQESKKRDSSVGPNALTLAGNSWFNIWVEFELPNFERMCIDGWIDGESGFRRRDRQGRGLGGCESRTGGERGVVQSGESGSRKKRSLKQRRAGRGCVRSVKRVRAAVERVDREMRSAKWGKGRKTRKSGSRKYRKLGRCREYSMWRGREFGTVVVVEGVDGLLVQRELSRWAESPGCEWAGKEGGLERRIVHRDDLRRALGEGDAFQGVSSDSVRRECKTGGQAGSEFKLMRRRASDEYQRAYCRWRVVIVTAAQRDVSPMRCHGRRMVGCGLPRDSGY
ncbi:hypothetical protein C8R43DRAFT_950035 [Mycena crocata]|nr:hypothetical protein C8R43DRAFT_950035 [Mycena crocata]